MNHIERDIERDAGSVQDVNYCCRKLYSRLEIDLQVIHINCLDA